MKYIYGKSHTDRMRISPFLSVFPRLLFLLAVIIPMTFTTGQERFPFPQHDGDIQSPADFLGYRLGDRFTEYERSVDYFYYLAGASDRIQVEEYGRTYENRPLLVLTVSAEDNMAEIDDIRETQMKMVDAFRLPESEQAGFLDQPVVTSFSYNIHGNEASSTEAAHQVAYELATTEDPYLLGALEESVILMFICINPDGRNRYVNWYNTVARHTGGAEPRDLEHYAPWPNGRTNHYWFDLNRDWIWGVHPESRGHTAAYQRWMPQVHVDYHEQGYNANYFTAPGTTPRNFLLPDSYEAWSDTFGRANIAEFDKKGLSYFTRDRFDFYYPSYGSSYPSVMGGIGMLTEQGGIGAGRAIEAEDGYVLTLRQRVYDHYTTSLATIKASARNRRALLEYSLSAWDPINSKEPTNAYVIEDDGNPFLEDFLKVMLLNGAEVERTTSSLTASGLNYRSGEKERKTFPAGSIIIPTEQSRHLFVNSLLGRNLYIEDSVMYDMATWSAPLAYNLNAWSLGSPVQVDTEPVTSATLYETGMVSAAGTGPAYAYVIDYNQRNAPKALSKLWEKEYRVRSAHAPFTTLDGRTFSAGSLIVLAGRNVGKAADMAADMAAVAKDAGVNISAEVTGRVASGDDIGNSRHRPVKQPKVAMLVEPPFNTYTSGQLYFLFDQETELPVERIRVSTLAQTAIPKFGSRYGLADLDDYDVLLLPGANRLSQVWKDESLQALTDWIRNGGTVVALEGSALFFSKEGKVSDLGVASLPRDTAETARLLTYAERENYRGKRRIPGSALRSSVDQTHPLAFGVEPEVFTLKFGTNALIPSNNLQSVARYLDDAGQLLTAGYAADENLNVLAGKTWAGVQSFGSGKIVYLLDNPHYRMFWRGPSRMVQNAVMLLPGF